ncbi:hypothetical protein FACS1894211_14800 [Clostridia bacterium]|nr:hypothetical protein FACS1894211_14800 [Clostridia bacterium]
MERMNTTKRTKTKTRITMAAVLFALVFLFAGGFFSYPFNEFAGNSLNPEGIFSARAETNIQSFTGGGTAESPYLISAPEHLDGLRGFCGEEHKDKNFKLTQNIDLTDYLAPGGAGYNAGKGWRPIGGDGGDAFFGNLDGSGFTVGGLWIDRPTEEYAGLFGRVRGSEIQNLRVVLDPVKGIQGNDFVGGLIADARNRNDGAKNAVSKCSVEGNLTSVNTAAAGDASVGGLFGWLDGYTVLESRFSGSVVLMGTLSALTYAGGLAGFAFSGNVLKNCSADAQIVGGTYSGGLLGGYYDALNAENCFVALRGETKAYPFFGPAVLPTKKALVTNCYYLDTESVRAFNEVTHHRDTSAFVKLNEQEAKDKAQLIGFDFDNMWGFDKDGNLILRSFGAPSVTLAVYKDGAVWNDCGKAFTLNRETATRAFGSGNDVHAADAANGAWAVYDGGTDTGAAVNLYGANEVVTLHYYTVTFSVTDAGKAGGSTVTAVYGGEPIDSGAVVLGGKTLTLTVTENGAGKKGEYTRLWSGLESDGGDAAGKTVTVRNLSGAVNLAVTVTGTIPPADLTWLWIALAVLIAGAAAGAAGLYFYRRKQPKTITETVTNTVTEIVEIPVEVIKEVVRDVPVIEGQPLPADLSPKEKEVAELLLLGKSRVDIARALRISEGTVKSHIYRIFTKDGVDNQREFIIRHLGKDAE